ASSRVSAWAIPAPVFPPATEPPTTITRPAPVAFRTVRRDVAADGVGTPEASSYSAAIVLLCTRSPCRTWTRGSCVRGGAAVFHGRAPSQNRAAGAEPERSRRDTGRRGTDAHCDIGARYDTEGRRRTAGRRHAWRVVKGGAPPSPRRRARWRTRPRRRDCRSGDPS